MLFDVLNKLNDELREMVRGRIDPMPRIIGVTDGDSVQIMFLDKVVWDSTNWTDSVDLKFVFGEEAKVQHELDRIEAHIKDAVMDYLLQLFEIQW